MFDIIISGGEIFDGSGKPAFSSDIGIDKDRISLIGNLSNAEAKEIINAAGLAVAPGFIDIHTHSDFTLLVNGAAESQVHQGVTLEVIGQCGISLAPLGDSGIAISSILGYHPGTNITWKTFGEYLSRLEQQELGVNVMAFVGHGTIRRAVMNEELRFATRDDIKEMVRLLEISFAEGASGFSSGLEYWPGSGSVSTTEELFSLCEVTKHNNALYATHVRNRDMYYDLGFSEALAIARNSGVKLQISHIQPKFGAPSHAMEHTIEMVHWAREEGADVTFDIIPHDWNHSQLTAALPSWAMEGGIEELMVRLNNPNDREKMKKNTQPFWQLVPAGKWDKIRLLQSKKNKNLIGLTFEQIGKDRGKDPYDAYFDLLIEEKENLNGLMWTSHGFSESDICLCLKQPDCIVMSDTMALAPYGALKGMIGSLSGYGWIARFFQHYVREKSIISME
ncbi:amidohydrolase family protein, partial [Patescibacteria group bacterium]|nr:amidohydrolase family protein [Patescibacteria group bacterium]